MQVCWQCHFAESAGAASTTIQPALTSRGLTTSFSQANIEGGPSSRDCAPTNIPAARPDASLNRLFANQVGPGWLGGDSTYSTALPGGKEGFVFGDTLIGTAAPDGHIKEFKGMVHDSELVGTMPALKPDLGGTSRAPKAVIPNPKANDGWQIGATYTENGRQLVFVNEGAPVKGSIYGTYTGRSAIAIMSLASGAPTFSSLDVVPTDPTTQWGNTLFQSGGYDYIYGIDFNTKTDVWHGLKVARVRVGHSLEFSQWSYWDGTSWVSGEPNAAVTGIPLVNGVIPLKGGSGFMGVGTSGSGSKYSVYLTFSCSPTGPWSPGVNVYSIPETAKYRKEIAYTATFHPELRGDGLVASYNIDSLDGLPALKQNDHEYQPHFIQITSGTTAGAPVSAPEVPAALFVPLAGMAVCVEHRYRSTWDP
jgi:hypothetical protein